MIHQLIDLIREASKLMANIPASIKQKGNTSNYVTSTDLAVQNFLEERLKDLSEGSCVLGEEGNGIVKDAGKVWIVDPIDGTSNFIRNMGLSVISVAYMENRELKMGVVYNPYRDEMFYAESGKGAFLNGKSINVSDRDFAHSHLCSAMSPYEKKYAKPCFNIIEKVYSRSDDLRRLGSAALEMAYLAAGRVELYCDIRVFAWDVAAAVLLIKEAGGHVGVYGSDGILLNKPFPVYAANTAENMNELEKSIYEEIPEPLY